MNIEFFLQLNSILGLSVLALLLAQRTMTYPQRQSSPIAIPVKVREDG